MTIQELQQKREYLEYLKTIYSFTKEELEGIIKVYNHIIFLHKEERSFPYPKGFTYSLTEGLLKDLNWFILSEYLIYLPCEKGAYRLGRGNDYVGDRLLPNKEIFIPKLKELITWYEKSEMEFIDKLTIFCLQFLCDIHPFYDGNGRTARAFINLELMRKSYPMIDLKYQDNNAYLNAVESYYNQSNTEPMKKLILNCINSQRN